MDNHENLSVEAVEAAASLEQKEEIIEETVQLIVFKLGNEEYALPIDQIKEIVPTPGIAKMPQTPPYIKGVANIRGNIIAVIDLEEKFGLVQEDQKKREGNFTLVIESEEHKGGIVVREVPNTLNVKKSALSNSSNVVQYSSIEEDCISGIVKIGDRLVILLDSIKVLEKEQIQR
jgi:purine-binding chemotaxis protein CheW